MDGEETRECTKVTAASEDLVLVVASGSGEAVVSLRGRSITIGRGASNDVVLSDPSVSGTHCQVEERCGTYRIRDLGSRNGTLLNGMPVREALLAPGARVGLGRAVLVCVPRRRHVGLPDAPGGLVGRSAPMARVHADIARFAGAEAPVLIEGETGTGKELAARALHELSARRHGPFVAVNCGALTPELASSELFGHEKGAFTGAETRRRGAFEQANGGTLLLDEVGELEPRVQAALLRVLETRRVRPLGGREDRPVDLRVLSATNRDLARAVEAREFRLDLFHRLAVLRLAMSPLRHRLDDVPLLAEALLVRAGATVRPDLEALDLLGRHWWPGNVRELRNVLERAAALAGGSSITTRDLRIDAFVGSGLSAADRELLATVACHGGSVAAAARALGIPRTTLRDRLTRTTTPR